MHKNYIQYIFTENRGKRNYHLNVCYIYLFIYAIYLNGYSSCFNRNICFLENVLTRIRIRIVYQYVLSRNIYDWVFYISR